MSRFKFRLWLKATVNSACGDVPYQIPPLEMFEVGDSLQNGGVIESGKLICGGHGSCCDRLFVTMCRFKFRLWLKATVSSVFNNAIYLLRMAKRRELHKAIINKSGYSDML